MYISPQGEETPLKAYSNYKAIKLEIKKNALNNKYTAPEKVLNLILNNSGIKEEIQTRILDHLQ